MPFVSLSIDFVSSLFPFAALVPSLVRRLISRREGLGEALLILLPYPKRGRKKEEEEQEGARFLFLFPL